jgi:hypothetical protein
MYNYFVDELKLNHFIDAFLKFNPKYLLFLFKCTLYNYVK